MKIDDLSRNQRKKGDSPPPLFKQYIILDNGNLTYSKYPKK